MDPAKNLQVIRKDFERVVELEVSFAKAVDSLQAMGKNKRYYPLRKERKHRLREISFLSVFIAWEEFLETAFETYLILGSHSNPRMRAKISVKELDVARELMKIENRRGISWASCEVVINRSQVYFEDGEPFKTPLKRAKASMDQIQTLRNRIAHHHSMLSKDKYSIMIRNLYGSGKRWVPGEFLFEEPSPALLQGANPDYATVFDYYADILTATSSLIIS